MVEGSCGKKLKVASRGAGNDRELFPLVMVRGVGIWLASEGLGAEVVVVCCLSLVNLGNEVVTGDTDFFRGEYSVLYALKTNSGSPAYRAWSTPTVAQRCNTREGRGVLCGGARGEKKSSTQRSLEIEYSALYDPT